MTQDTLTVILFRKILFRNSWRQYEVNWAATLTLNVNTKIVLLINIFLTLQSIIFLWCSVKIFPNDFISSSSFSHFFFLLRKQPKNILTSSLNN